MILPLSLLSPYRLHSRGKRFFLTFAGLLLTAVLRGQAPLIETDLRHTLGPLLPIPGKAPAWPMNNIGKWRIDVNAAVPAWLAEVKVWRHEHYIRMGYDDAQYRRPELLW